VIAANALVDRTSRDLDTSFSPCEFLRLQVQALTYLEA
jgi:hypothetical protein